MPSEIAWKRRGLDSLKKMKSCRIKDIFIICRSNFLKRYSETGKIYTFFVTIILHKNRTRWRWIFEVYVLVLLRDFWNTLWRIAWNIMVEPLHLILPIVFCICVMIQTIFKNLYMTFPTYHLKTTIKCWKNMFGIHIVQLLKSWKESVNWKFAVINITGYLSIK